MSETELSATKPDLGINVRGSEGVVEVTGCWSNYGVYGDGTCAELRQFVHCRNCPVYSSAGVRLLDRPLPPNYRNEWTQHFAQEKRFAEAGGASAILFRIQNEWFALPTHTLQEVAEKRPIHSVPRQRQDVLLGLANMRGELVICISVGHLLKLEKMPGLESLRQNYHRLLVLHWETGRLAFPVDEVQGPHRFHPQELKSPPATAARGNFGLARAVVQWQERTAGLLDPQWLLTSLHRCL